MSTCPSNSLVPRFAICQFYLNHGYCRCRVATLVTDEELSNSEFVRDIRSHAASYHLGAEQFVLKLLNDYRDFPGAIVNDQGQEVIVALSVLEDIAARLDWVREWACTSPPPRGRLHIRKEARERARAIATILRAANPAKARFWGVRGTNDNEDRPI